MSDVLILGTDTDVGKTTLALLWLAAFAEEYEYWKPVETGESDSGRLAELVPGARVHESVRRFQTPVAPPLAARLEQGEIPPGSRLAGRRPKTSELQRHLLVETFGSPFSPLNETQLQIELVKELSMPTILVSSSALGAVGRTLQCLLALASNHIHPRAVVLVGNCDPFAEQAIRQHAGGLAVIALHPPTAWTVKGVRAAAADQIDALMSLRRVSRDAEPMLRSASRLTLAERDRRSVWHPYTSLQGSDPPLPCVGAQDEYLFLEDGRRIIDAISSWWTILHGHRFPPLMAALRQAMDQWDHVLFAGLTHDPAVELADLLLESLAGERETASQGGRVFYSDDGSTAVEVALKMAYQYWCHQGQPQRQRFVGFLNGYHGDTFGAMAVSRDPVFFGRFEPLLLRADILPVDPTRLDEHLARHATETAGVIIEPLVQGAGGMCMHTPETLRQIFEVTRAHDVLFIADEVMTANRTGRMWAHHAAGIVPDLVCAGKTLTGGILPLAATLVSPRVVAAFDTADRSRTFFHGHSFTAHPLACAVAAANWKLLTPTRSASETMQSFWEEKLRPLVELPQVREVRICGSIAAVELEATGGYLADVGQRMRRASLENGVLLRPLGPVLYTMPPLRTSPESLEQIAETIKKLVATC